MVQSRVDMKRGRKKRSPFRRFVKIMMIVFVLLLVTAGGAAAYMATQLNNVTTSASQELERGERSEMREEAVTPSSDNVSILFLGVDDRDGDLSGRSDALLLATFNQEEGSVKVLSIPRDTLVDIPGRGEDKINHAHAYDGVDLTIDTIEGLLDIPVDYFVTLNFVSFVEIVDIFDGVTVDSPMAFTEMDSDDNPGAIEIEEGEQTLDGEEALAYARMRKMDPEGDIGRGERQQQVLEALMRKGASFRSITRFDDVMGSLEEHLKTNLSFNDIVGMHSYATSMDSIESINFEGNHATYNNIYYYELTDASVEEISTELRRHLELEDGPDEDESDDEENDNEETE
ncbi:LCP family protein [Alkalicoccus urumqiensis]|uniref:Transcriptional regulator n=1 Tax=Alkalicoccus urumqiensis TaxID=1548213 RepID=A0A2P6MHB4_ALKUR|nr:LCP family protein [Alkalicoccus urumqiensis]PRO65679.1 transcriptional regulator [Alkalicoccus urumqiensis]